MKNHQCIIIHKHFLQDYLKINKLLYYIYIHYQYHNYYLEHTPHTYGLKYCKSLLYNHLLLDILHKNDHSNFHYQYFFLENILAKMVRNNLNRPYNNCISLVINCNSCLDSQHLYYIQHTDFCRRRILFSNVH